MKPPFQALQVLKHNHFQSRLTQLCRFANLFRGCNTAEQVKGWLKETHLCRFKAGSPQTRHDAPGTLGSMTGVKAYGLNRPTHSEAVEGIASDGIGKGEGRNKLSLTGASRPDTRENEVRALYIPPIVPNPKPRKTA